MAEYLFYFFAVFTLLTASMMICARNPVNSAMFMILAFAGTAGLFALMGAFFLAAIQIIVYAGAVIALFLFVIMLLDIDKQAKFPGLKSSATLALLVFALLVVGIGYLFPAEAVPGSKVVALAPGPNIKDFGALLFTKYLLPLQTAGFLLLVAMIGVIYISKTPKKEDAGKGRSS